MTAKKYFLVAGWHTNLPRFQGVRADHVRVESSSWCFPRELVSFDPWHVTGSPPIGKRISVGRYIRNLRNIENGGLVFRGSRDVIFPSCWRLFHCNVI